METNGRKDCHNIPHRSGEVGCRGYLQSTWRAYSIDTLGYVAERNPVNEKYVTLKKIQSWLEDGKTKRQIFLTWNQGNDGACGSGVNGYEVEYDSCHYAAKALKLVQ